MSGWRGEVVGCPKAGHGEAFLKNELSRCITHNAMAVNQILGQGIWQTSSKSVLYPTVF